MTDALQYHALVALIVNFDKIYKIYKVYAPCKSRESHS